MSHGAGENRSSSLIVRLLPMVLFAWLIVAILMAVRGSGDGETGGTSPATGVPDVINAPHIEVPRAEPIVLPLDAASVEVEEGGEPRSGVISGTVVRKDNSKPLRGCVVTVFGDSKSGETTVLGAAFSGTLGQFSIPIIDVKAGTTLRLRCLMREKAARRAGDAILERPTGREVIAWLDLPPDDPWVNDAYFVIDVPNPAVR
jgi:hypothetical protein